LKSLSDRLYSVNLGHVISVIGFPADCSGQLANIREMLKRKQFCIRSRKEAFL
jgi:hypothetical protein